MHAQVRASHLNSKQNTLVVGTDWENSLETIFLPGWVWDTSENLGKQTWTSWVPVTTRVLCVTQSLGLAFFNVNVTVEKLCQNKIGSSKVKTCIKKKSNWRLKGHNLGA